LAERLLGVILDPALFTRLCYIEIPFFIAMVKLVIGNLRSLAERHGIAGTASRNKPGKSRDWVGRFNLFVSLCGNVLFSVWVASGSLTGKIFDSVADTMRIRQSK
jgi:hypothetical protein